MSPDAPPFTPSPSTNGSSTLVSSTPEVSVEVKEGGCGSNLAHEDLLGLVEAFKVLSNRCDDMEAENAALKEILAALTEPTGPARNEEDDVKPGRNLCGYASSESSDEETDPAFALEKKFDALDSRVQHHISTVEQILQKFRDHLVDEMESRKTLAKELDHTRVDLTRVKGRTGVHDKNFKELEDRVEQVTSTDVLRSPVVDSEVAGYSSLHGVLAELKDMQKLIADLEGEVSTHGVLLYDPQAIGGMGDVKDEDDLAKKCPSVNRKLEILRTRHHQLKVQVEQHVKQKARIDDAHSKDSLYELYHHLTREINSLQEDELYRPVGAFQGTVDELCALRDGVVCRLAIFDKYNEALSEAKKADVEF